MFSVRQKREIADAVQKILRDTNHPELPEGEISFKLSVSGAAPWSWATICNNGEVPAPTVNPWNELQDPGSDQMESKDAKIKRLRERLADAISQVRWSCGGTLQCGGCEDCNPETRAMDRREAKRLLEKWDADDRKRIAGGSDD